ncbi:hypothetical protein ABK040_008923 [Willaertia magna]
MSSNDQEASLLVVGLELSVPSNQEEHVDNLKAINTLPTFLNQFKSINNKQIYIFLINHNNNESFKSIHLYKDYYSEIISIFNDFYKYKFVIVFPYLNEEKERKEYLLNKSQKNSKSSENHIYSLVNHFNNQTIETKPYLNPIMSNSESDTTSSLIKNNELTNELNQNYSFQTILNNLNEKERDLYQHFQILCMGGTFDRLHLGHNLLATQLLLLLSKEDNLKNNSRKEIEIGVSVGPLLEKKVLKERIQPFQLRKEKLEELLKDIHPLLDLSIVNIFELFEPWGPILTDPILECLVVSEETLSGGLKGNEKRVNELNFKPYALVSCPLLLPRKENTKLSSTQLRELIN